jgi:glycerol-1-phosphate dehydrogenase [NAD(P)+]
MMRSVATDVETILSDELLGQVIPCTCGREHRIHTRRVAIEPDVADQIPAMLPSLIPGERILLVADQRTWEKAGARLSAALSTGYAVTDCRLRDPANGELHASVELVDELAAAYSGTYDMFAAVGSGTVNDLTKEMAQRCGKPYFVLATAASMNGYTSSIVALLEKGLKTTRPATPPVAVFADPRVLAQAPQELTLAGLGDLISKPYCGCDWKIASLVKGVEHCPLPDQLLSKPFAEALTPLQDLGRGEPEAVTLLLRLLLVSGLSMAIAGTSSPASGAEHLLSHYWDMVHLRDHRPIALHGAQVGVASLVIDKLYWEILRHDFSSVRFKPSPPHEQARMEVQSTFGTLADAVWAEWSAKLTDRSEHDLVRLQEHEATIKEEIAETLALGEQVRQTMIASGAPTEVGALGNAGEELVAAVLHGRKIRSRFTALDVAAELGLLAPFAERLTARNDD